MKRKDQIKKFMEEESIPESYQGYVLDGIAWADEHPNNPFINVPIHMSNNTYKIWLEKACKWLNDNFANANEQLICYIGNSDMNVMIKHFRKYMNEQQ